MASPAYDEVVEKPSQEILERIVKLLNTTVEKGATVSEAATAASMAQKLLLRYNLEVSDLRAARKSKVVDGGFELQKHTWTIPFDWQLTLVREICKHNFAMVLDYEEKYFRKAGKWGVSKINVVGRKENVEVVQYLYSMLYTEVHRLSAQARRSFLARKHTEKIKSWYGLPEGACPHWTDSKEVYEARGESRRPTSCPRLSDGDLGSGSETVWEKSFGEGAVEEIAKKLAAQRRFDEGDVDPDQRALILLIDKEVEDEWYRRKHGLVKDDYDLLNQLRGKALDAGYNGKEFDLAVEAPNVSDELREKLTSVTSEFKRGQAMKKREEEAARRGPDLAKPAAARFSTRRSYKTYTYRPPKEPIGTYDAYEAGVREGKKISLRAGVGGSDEARDSSQIGGA